MFYHQLSPEAGLQLLEHRHANQLFYLTDQSRNHLRKWLPWIDQTQTVEHSLAFIDSALKQFSNNTGLHLGIWYKGELAGVIGLHHIDWGNRSTSIGYWLGEKFQGKGLITSACKAIINYCFLELQLNRIEVRVATKNIRSAAIPQRLGFHREGQLRKAEWLYDTYVDHYVYSLIKDDLSSH
ncbi:MAG: GNAT family N-acetyltransferase [Bacillota bacterium]|uniref:GNAT family N-acetyltransferase n=1 Tax=Virgibacillus salarius TaxID=447199 RepID=A0A941DSU1_9BACI|nr:MULTISPECIES: GNAT family protein [Bacillaceae]NAZ07783.1 GNAT family N-acetyltransferase [Agaribacter marinus]MBR7795066.1 GNAT family N-acetyltransferase [Virgibacillus salarius]MCC2248430.1 GNAT family N-acetyltransferase [Virgibacillus sp. AGTR]MDY7043137.1 GNAT family protein [Virgibacillus sp. M23]QRZ16706.1 GNAT family N-acetyltransferase [Virgibacillus sp. AGTR]